MFVLFCFVFFVYLKIGLLFQSQFNPVEAGKSDSCSCGMTYAYDSENPDLNNCFLDLGFNKWGWTIGELDLDYLSDANGSVEWDLYLQAHGCDTNNGDIVGTALLEYDLDYNDTQFFATLTVTSDNGYHFTQIDLWVGNEKLPRNSKGEFTINTKKYVENVEGDEITYHQFSGTIAPPFWMSIHARVKLLSLIKLNAMCLCLCVV